MTKVQNAQPAIGPNMSIHAAISAGALSANTQITAINGKAVTSPNATLHALMSSGVLNPSMLASTLTYTPSFGGD